MIRNGLLSAAVFLIGVVTAVAQVNTILEVDNDIRLIMLHDSVYVHVTWDYHENFGRFSSNGLILIRNSQALMVDTPMDNEKTERLTNFIRDSLSADVTTLIIGHFHDDCLGGLEYLHQNGINSIANTRTVTKCRELGLP